jgi:hypothetical protein
MAAEFSAEAALAMRQSFAGVGRPANRQAWRIAAQRLVRCP